MKLLAFLFTFYIVLLPCFPCMDTDECIDNSKTATAISSTDHNNHQHENEACNPFCSCACCGQVFYPNFHLAKIAAKPTAHLKQQFFYTNVSLSSDYFGNIWQPPKIS